MSLSQPVVDLMTEAIVLAKLGWANEEHLAAFMKIVFPKQERLALVRDPWYQSDSNVKNACVSALAERLRMFWDFPGGNIARSGVGRNCFLGSTFRYRARLHPYSEFKKSLPLYNQQSARVKPPQPVHQQDGLIQSCNVMTRKLVTALIEDTVVEAKLWGADKNHLINIMEIVFPKAERLSVVSDRLYQLNCSARLACVSAFAQRLRLFWNLPGGNPCRSGSGSYSLLGDIFLDSAALHPYSEFKKSLPLNDVTARFDRLPQRKAKPLSNKDKYLAWKNDTNRSRLIKQHTKTQEESHGR